MLSESCWSSEWCLLILCQIQLRKCPGTRGTSARIAERAGKITLVFLVPQFGHLPLAAYFRHDLCHDTAYYAESVTRSPFQYFPFRDWSMKEMVWPDPYAMSRLTICSFFCARRHSANYAVFESRRRPRSCEVTFQIRSSPFWSSTLIVQILGRLACSILWDSAFAAPVSLRLYIAFSRLSRCLSLRRTRMQCALVKGRLALCLVVCPC